jgi:hypothetical protein
VGIVSAKTCGTGIKNKKYGTAKTCGTGIKNKKYGTGIKPKYGTGI